MASGIVIFGVIGGIAITGLLVWLITTISKVKDEEEDTTTIINLMPQFANNRAYGTVKKIQTGAGGRYVIDMEPRDLMPKNAKKAKMVRFVVDTGKLIVLPKGTVSQEKNVLWALPPTAKDLSEVLKSTPIGKVLAFYTEVQDAENTVINSLIEGSKRKTEHITKMGDGEVSGRQMEDIIEHYEAMLKSARDTKSVKEPFKPTGQ